MAQKRSSQRGVVRLACSLLLATMATLLSLTGCSAGETGDTASEGSSPEHVGSVKQMLTCGTTTCMVDTCLDVSCSLVAKDTCVYKPVLKDGDACKSSTGEGVCVTPYRGTAPACCTGCVGKSLNGPVCINAPDAKNCGDGGKECINCDANTTCNQHACKAGQCVDGLVIGDDKPCTDQSGKCWQGSCCNGCIDDNKVCQPGGGLNSCGKTTAVTPLAKCVDCNDSEKCTTDSCGNDGKCANAAVANNTPCLDTNLCDGAESCQNGVCTDQTGFMCPAPVDVCHQTSCDASGCGYKALTGNTCNDGDACTVGEACNNGACGGGTKKGCDDNNPCTIDDCDPKTGCTHTKLTAGESCDDGNLCNGIGVCDANAQCVIKASPKCDDGNPCTDDPCTPAKGCDTPVPNTAACNDGDPCTITDKCSAGACVGSGTLKCDDGNSCTDDACTKGVGCTSNAVKDGATCDDGNDCSTGDKCVAGKCKSSGGKTCPDDTNQCTVATCDPSAGNACGQTNDDTLKCQVDKCHAITQCANGVCPTGAIIDCNDANPCTKDDCDPATGCTHDPDNAATCSDGDLCTTGDACVGGECVTKDVACKPLGACYTAGTCNPKTGLCDAPRADPGTPCNNDTGSCDENGTCMPNPDGAGGAGGETGVGGDGTAGTFATGGSSGTTGTGGTSTEPQGSAGEAGTPTTETGGGTTSNGGSAGKSSGATSNNEAGAPEVPDHVFVRDPGGCSCSLPAAEKSSSELAWLGVLALAGLVASRRGRRGSRDAANARKLV